MNDPILSPDVARLARAIRFALVAFVLGGSYFTVRASLSISVIQIMFTDMLGGKPLPTLTNFVIAARPALIFVSVLVPLLAVSTLFSRRLIASFYLIGVLGLVVVADFALLWHALSSPFTTIITSMQSGM